MDRFAVPETAIATFERVHAVLVTLHDFTGRIRARLKIDRGYHRHPLCHAAKARDHERACLDFDLVALHAAAPMHPSGFLQRCHAGLVEAVVPLRLNGSVVGVLNAGPRAVGDTPLPILRSMPLAAGMTLPRLPTWNVEQAQDVLEGLRQLACRLERWMDDVGVDHTVTARDRRSRILHVIDHGSRRHLTLADLASELGLSVDRTGHVVRQEFGMPFLDLLAKHRLERAAALLGHSDLPIATIALHCGFGDLSGFHRRFRAHFEITPARYRTRTRHGDFDQGTPPATIPARPSGDSDDQHETGGDDCADRDDRSHRDHGAVDSQQRPLHRQPTTAAAPLRRVRRRG